MYVHERQARTSKVRSVIAAVVAMAAAGLPGPAHAQGFIDFLWGGSAEYGGSKQTVSFDKKYSAGQVIVSFGDRRLYLITRPGTAISYPIAVPREQSRWSGVTTVTMKKENPAWTPTPEMIRENPRLPRWVPGGHPMNPLGVRGLYLGSSTYRIHGTDAPWTIGQAVSKGCIRMFNEDVLDLYPRVPVGTKVTVTWNRFKTSGGDDTASSLGSSGPAFSPFFGPAEGSAPRPERKTIKFGRKPLPPQRRAAVE
jgi:lipoprotein-anchoring transpeptidase ErfK/SrfK